MGSGVGVGFGVGDGSGKGTPTFISGVSVALASSFNGLEDVWQAPITRKIDKIPKTICFRIVGLYRNMCLLSNKLPISVGIFPKAYIFCR
jgi:hypothetical protein